jgi:SynChlorMet cassette protein ScmA
MEKKKLDYEKPTLKDLDLVGKGISAGPCGAGSGAAGACSTGAAAAGGCTAGDAGF